MSPDFKELLQLFNANQVEYLIVGGYAVIMWKVSNAPEIYSNPAAPNLLIPPDTTKEKSDAPHT